MRIGILIFLILCSEISLSNSVYKWYFNEDSNALKLLSVHDRLVKHLGIYGITNSSSAT